MGCGSSKQDKDNIETDAHAQDLAKIILNPKKIEEKLAEIMGKQKFTTPEFDENDNIHEQYQLGEIIDDDGFGKVQIAKHRLSSKTRAVKTISKFSINRSQVSRENFLDEIAVMRYIRHPNIVRLHEVYEDDKNWYLVNDL